MRIEPSTPSRPAASTGRRDPASGRADGRGGRGDGARPFGALARPRTVGANADLPSEAAAALQATRSWAVPEGPVTSAPHGVRSVARTAESGHPPPIRLLIGSGPQGPEARLQIAAGPLAGTEIQVRATVAGVQVTVLTADAFARQTLVAAMNDVTSRLRQSHRVTAPTARTWGAPPRTRR